MSDTIIPAERIEKSILLIRGERVMIDSDLALLYEVETKVLNRAVKRNLLRFPNDFMFQLTAKETEALRFHFGTSKGRGGRRYRPYVFTEQGVAAFEHLEQRPSRSGQHRHNSHIRKIEENPRFSLRAFAEVGRVGKEVRPSV